MNKLDKFLTVFLVCIGSITLGVHFQSWAVGQAVFVLVTAIITSRT